MHFYDSAALRPRTRMHRPKSALPDKMLSAVYPLDEIQTAFEDMLARSDHWLKVIIRIDEKEK